MVSQRAERMKTNTSPWPKDESPSELIDAKIKELNDWRGKTLSQLRALIKQADPAVVEELKWKKPPTKGEPPSGIMTD